MVSVHASGVLHIPRLDGGKRKSMAKTPTCGEKRKDSFGSDLLEQPGAREVPIIIKGGQRNSKDLRCLLVVHPSEIP